MSNDWRGWILEITDEFESVANWILGGRKGFAPDAPVSVACIESGQDGRVTGNQTLLAACILGIVSPSLILTPGPEMDHEHEAGWAEPGVPTSCAQLMSDAVDYQLNMGMHGTREPWGYGSVYRMSYILAALHDPTRDRGALLLWSQLAVYSLLWGKGKTIRHGREVREGGSVSMGCRTWGDLLDDLNTTAVHLARGDITNIVGRDAGGRVLSRALKDGLLAAPMMKTPDDAVTILSQRGAPGCALGFEWYDLGGVMWGARIEEPWRCERKRGVSPATVCGPDGVIRTATKGEVGSWERRASRWLRMDEQGTSLNGEWEVTPPPKTNILEKLRSDLIFVRENGASRRIRTTAHRALVELNNRGAW